MSELWAQVLLYERAPLTANQRLHWAKKAKITAAVRRVAAAHFRDFPPVARVRVELEWHVLTAHRRDVDNIVPTLKALADGLVDAGIAPDDTPQFMDKRMPVIIYHPPGEPGRPDKAHMVLRVTEIQEGETA
ncbi:hypothetical protein D9V30_00205 [Mycetocola reblochoni]|uniref:Phage protein n=2 Tax=Mycetocola reblochoni TaxID=331618 RepID=A0A1R4IYM4_9MICO|nr:hypothetical protein [Mycetocola reblochoni]RLP70894.1 hypothetical protein D9V30_00205 [Mycetocola reblochoni]SJN24665.1 Phage protein [Mycetocola reblochoni REB411]